MGFRYQLRVLGMDGRPSQDCAAVRQEPEGCLRIALADGVGGQAGGREAAQRAVDDWLDSNYDPAIQMAETDSLLSRLPEAGLTTSIYLRLTAKELTGASVGDSQVWFQEGHGRWRELTEQQRLRPFLGSGEAIPIPFSLAPLRQGRLLICSDGLWRQASQDRMLELAAQEAVEELLLLPRMVLSKTYADDVSFVLVGWDSSRR